MTVKKLDPYVHRMQSFLEHKVDANEFERRYLSMFKTDTSSWTEAEYENLNNLFAEVDAFCGNHELRSENDIDEEQLREATKMVLGKLTSLSPGNMP